MRVRGLLYAYRPRAISLKTGYLTRAQRSERDVDPATIPLPPEFPVPKVGSRMKCSACGSRKVETKPELYPGGIEAMRQRRRDL
jgi:hypothetical protein